VETTIPSRERSPRQRRCRSFNGECHIVDGDTDLAANFPVSVVGDTDAARLCNYLQPHGDVDAIAENIVVIDDDVADMDADAEFDPLVLRHGAYDKPQDAEQFAERAFYEGLLGNNSAMSGCVRVGRKRKPRSERCPTRL
jgi:hypothetical protein